ncbi:DNA primase, large subunit, partial [Tilletiaria anomala UBC 951]
MFRGSAASSSTVNPVIADIFSGSHGAAFQHPDTFAPTSLVGSGGGGLGAGAATGAALVAVADVAQHSTRRGQSKHPFRLNFYLAPPVQGLEISIEEFEMWALDRLRVLAEIESCQARGKPYPEIIKHMSEQLKKYIPLSSNTALNVNHFSEREKDHISHFVLRLAFCRSEELRRRFVKAETMLFKLRFDADDTREREAFLNSLKLDWQPVSEEEKERLRPQLQSASPRTRKSWPTERFYKVPWLKVPDLIERRRVYLHAGMAYVPAAEQSSLVLAEFTSRLEQQMELTARHIPRRLDLDEDERLIPILEHLSMGLLVGLSSASATGSHALFGPDAEGNAGRITWNMIDVLVKRHAPMCVRNLQETLNTKHHLKHLGRLQYNLFLKELGLPIDEALVFWRKSFSLMTDDKFNKEYRYNIRHGYGMEGGKKNYPAPSCAKILTQNQPGPQDTHGCPFRHMGTSNLQSALWTQYGVTTGEAGDIMKAVKDGHYHIGCTRLFEITHRKRGRGGLKKGDGLGVNGETVAHPNRYFERSYLLEKQAQEAGAS